LVSSQSASWTPLSAASTCAFQDWWYVRFSFSETGDKNVVREGVAESAEEEESKAMVDFRWEVGFDTM
jgi:hypothetical protein